MGLVLHNGQLFGEEGGLFVGCFPNTSRSLLRARQNKRRKQDRRSDRIGRVLGFWRFSNYSPERFAHSTNMACLKIIRNIERDGIQTSTHFKNPKKNSSKKSAGAGMLEGGSKGCTAGWTSSASPKPPPPHGGRGVWGKGTKRLGRAPSWLPGWITLQEHLGCSWASRKAVTQSPPPEMGQNSPKRGPTTRKYPRREKNHGETCEKPKIPPTYMHVGFPVSIRQIRENREGRGQ